MAGAAVVEAYTTTFSARLRTRVYSSALYYHNNTSCRFSINVDIFTYIRYDYEKFSSLPFFI